MGTTKDKVIFDVLLGPADGGAVTAPDDEVPHLKPIRITRTAGGQKLDSAEFLYDLSDTGEHVENLATPTGYSRQVEIRIPGTGDEYTPIFWGDLTIQDLAVGRGEEVKVTAAIYPYHFGNPFFGPRFWDPLAATERTVHEEIVFNPNIDGIVEGNRSSKLDENENHELWADPESFRTSAAETYQGETIHVWTLAEAVNAICWRCNPDEEFIKNPQIFDQYGTPDAIFADALDPENERFPRGEYLPTYLDALLPKYGFGWFVKLTRVSDGGGGFETERRIQIFRLGQGTETTVEMQAFGSDLELDGAEPEFTNCLNFNLTTDVGKAVNTVYLDGGQKQHEVTIELYRGWPEADDAYLAEKLKKSDPESAYNTADKTLVWRLWPANEAGDYCSTRTVVAAIPAAPRDWSTFGVKFPRRRRIEDCLTYAGDGKRMAPYLEFSTDGGDTWAEVPPDWSFAIYQTQMAIEFVGDEPPAELVTAGAAAKLRVTCTLTGDERITATASRQAQSPNLRESAIVIPVGTRYAFRQIQTTGTYASVINDGSAPADTRDDSTALTTFGEYARSNAESAEMSGRFVLIGIDHGYQIGDLVTEVGGRNISLNRNSEAAMVEKFLQIVAIEFDENAQTTTLATSPRELDPNYRKGARPRGAAA